MMIEVNPTNVAYRMYNQSLNYHQISSCPQGHIYRRTVDRLHGLQMKTCLQILIIHL